MEVHPHFGPAMPDDGWVPSPGYVLRRHRALHHARSLRPGRALEIGCGAGAFLYDLHLLGHEAEGLETSARALELARSTFGADIPFHAAAQDGWAGRFDLIVAFEVLEHIEDDRGALAEWASWVRPGGHLLLSVPAHQRRWNPTDEWAGHYRRYESAGLGDLLAETGFETLALECYGFPLANALEAVRARTYQKGAQSDRAAATADSGVERTVEKRFWPLQTSLPGAWTMRALCRVQEAFLRVEVGNGFVALAKKR